MGQGGSGRDDSEMWSRGSAFVFGLLLIGAGIVLLAVNVFGLVLPFEFDQIGWPVFVIVPGLVLLVVGLVASGEAGQGMAVGGGIVTTIGLILAYQVATDHWTAWAYAWALIAPTSVGVSMLLWGLLHRRGDVTRQGLSALGVGIVMFTIGFAFFEGVLNISGDAGLAPLGRQALPIVLIVAGGLVILSRFWRRTEPAHAARTYAAPGYADWGPTSYGTAYTPAAEPPPPAPPAPRSAVDEETTT